MVDCQDILSFSRKLLLPYQFIYPNFNPLTDKQNKAKTDAFFASLEASANREAILYIHVPFCTSNCRFCDFDKTFKLSSGEAYVAQVLEEIEFYARFSYVQNLEITHVHFGGGTPTLLTIEQIEAIRQSVRQQYRTSGARWSIEASPDTAVKEGMLPYLCSGSFDRVSLGVQTFDEGLREALHIRSSIDDVRAALSGLSESDVELSVDLLYGLPCIFEPYDDQKRLMCDIDQALSGGVDSMELNLLYPLALMSAQGGAIRMPTSEQVIATRRKSASFLHAQGYQQYADFSFRKRGENISFEKAYFGGGAGTPDCMAFGASSFGYLNGTRYKNTGIASYMAMQNRISLLRPLTHQEHCDRKIVGFSKHMRLMKSALDDRQTAQRYGQRIQFLLDKGILVDEDAHYALTQEGKDYTDNIFFLMLTDDEQTHVLKNIKYYLYA